MHRILRGWRSLLAESNGHTCHKRHLLPDETVVNGKRLQELERAADELKIARGVIAGLGKSTDFATVVRETLGE